jgi:hypothetical protein
MGSVKGDFKVEFSVSENGRKSPQWTIDSDLNGEVSLDDLLKFTKANLILISDYALREEQEKGFDKDPVVAVDGKRGKPVSAVHPLGKIEFTSQQSIAEIVQEIYAAIQERSPIKTGKYKKSNYVFLNGKQVANDGASLLQWLGTNPQVEPKDIIRFVNVQPYARKLERYGVTAQRKRYRTKKSEDPRGRSGNALGQILAPNGTYYLATKSVNRKYKQNLQILFKFIPGSDLGLTASFVGKSSGAFNKKKKRIVGGGKKRTYLYPSIFLKIRDTGVK